MIFLDLLLIFVRRSSHGPVLEVFGKPNAISTGSFPSRLFHILNIEDVLLKFIKSNIDLLNVRSESEVRRAQ